MSDTSSKVQMESVLSASLYVVLLVAVLVYWPGLDGPFLLDDEGSIKPLTAHDFSLPDLLFDVTHNTSGLFGRPISIFSLSFTRILFGEEPWGFKYHNLLLHLLNALLLCWLLVRLLPRLVAGSGRQTILLIAVCTTMLWLLHPLMVSTVLYAVQRMAQLASLFTLAALLAYVYLREALSAPATAFYCRYLPVFLGMLLLAILSKENGALIPLYVLLIECLAFRWQWASAVERYRLLGFHSLFVLLPIILGVVYFLTHLETYANYSHRDFSMLERLLTQLHVLLFYVKLILLPAISDMSLFHDGWVPVRELDPVTFLLLGFWLAVAALVILLRNRAPVISFGLGWFIVSQLMESTIISLELVFEHRNYLASAGLLLVPVGVLLSLPGVRKKALLPLMLLAPLFAFMTHARVGEWESEEMIYSLAVKDHPESLRAQGAYAVIQYRNGNLEKALEHIHIARTLDETGYSALVINVLYLCGRGREDELQALIDDGKRRAATYPATPATISAMDILLEQVQLQRCKEVTPVMMLDWLNAAREQEANKANKLFTGYLQRQQGYMFYFQGERIKGYEHFIGAYENTGYASILAELVNIEIRLGSFEVAEHLIGILEEENQARFNTETALVEKSRAQLHEARRRASTPTVPSLVE